MHKLLFLFHFDIQNNFDTQHVLQMRDLPVNVKSFLVKQSIQYRFKKVSDLGADLQLCILGKKNLWF